MKKLIYTFAVLIIINCSLIIDNCQSQWVQTSNGMGTSQYVNSFATSGSSIFAGTGNMTYSVGNGVFLSTDNGLNWSQTVLNNRCIYSIITYGNYICAGTDSGAWLSENNGTNWTQSLNTYRVYSLTKLGNNVFAGAYHIYDTINVYSSANNGATWIPTGFGNHGAVFCFGTIGNYIYAGTGNGVYLTTNNGNSWASIGLIYNTISCLATIGNHIFAGSNGPSYINLFHSTNNGVSWNDDTTGMGTVGFYSLAISGTNIFVGTINGVYVSTNYGANWISKSEGFDYNRKIISLLIYNNYIFAGTAGHSVWRRPLSEFIGIKNISTEIPSAYSLSQNYPNPFNPTTNIKFDIAKNGHASIKIFDVLGKEIATLVNERLNAGTYNVDWNASGFPSGVYFYRLTSGDFIQTKKFTLLK